MKGDRARGSFGVAGSLLMVLLARPHANAADVEAGARKAASCVACHGANGNATLPGVPALAGQPAMHTFFQLLQFREKRRRDPEMSEFADKLTDRDMQDIGAYYAAQNLAGMK